MLKNGLVLQKQTNKHKNTQKNKKQKKMDLFCYTMWHESLEYAWVSSAVNIYSQAIVLLSKFCYSKCNPLLPCPFPGYFCFCLDLERERQRWGKAEGAGMTLPCSEDCCCWEGQQMLSFLGCVAPRAQRWGPMMGQASPTLHCNLGSRWAGFSS